jgi:hypothetical protein
LLLLAALGGLSFQLYAANKPVRQPSAEMVLHAEQGTADMSLRTADFPRTYVNVVRVDLTSPHQWVRLEWAGPRAGEQETGPFHSAPGKGLGQNDCNDTAESNRGGSKCTPKGGRLVEGFGDLMPSATGCKFVTWFHGSREIALHSHTNIPNHPASSGCVRLPEHAAQLIHNNSIAGRTQVIVDGTWTAPPPE